MLWLQQELQLLLELRKVKMIDISLLPMFIVAVFILMITPGVDMIYILSNALSGGTKAGVASTMGVATGVYIHTICAAFGLTAIFLVSDMAYNILKVVGALYLAYVGIQILLSKSGLTDINPADKKPLGKLYQRGVLTNFLNPKAILFVISFLPQFINPSLQTAVWVQTLILGIFIVAIMLIVYIPMVLFVGQISSFLKQSDKASYILDKVVGFILISLALKVLFTKKD